MKLYIPLLVLSVALLVSVACGAEPAPTPTPTLTMPPSPTALAMSTPALTATPIATPVPPTPTATPTLTPTPAASVIQTATPAPGWLEQRRQDLHIPGMAIAVVKDDDVIFARGFGLADLENETPVTPETIFAIASITKSFTAPSSPCSSTKARWVGTTR